MREEAGEAVPEPSAALLLVLIVVGFYAPVVLFGRSLLYYPRGVTSEGPYGFAGRRPVNTFGVGCPRPPPRGCCGPNAAAGSTGSGGPRS